MLKTAAQRAILYGCTLTNGGETWALNVYYKNISNLNSETFIIRNDNISCYSHSNGWIWLDYNITLNGSGYGDNFGEFANLPAEGTLVTSLGWNGGVVSEITAAQIEEYVTSVIDAYTYAETGNQYIVGYDVAVSNNISLVGGVLEVGIEITSTDKNWYPVTVNNNAVNGITAGAYAFDSYKRLGDTYFLEDGAEVTLTATASGGYELISVSGNVEGTAEGNTYKFVAGQGVVIDITWAELEINSITVYSDVSFYYNGALVAGESNNYYITEDLITATGGLSASGDIVTSDGYYFLGWAQYSNGTYTFVSDLTVDYELEGVSYYAIWGYGGSNTITGYTANGDLSKLGTASTSAEGVTFYGWYSAQSENFDSKYKITDGTISGTTVYARWNYTFDVNIAVNGRSDLYVNDSAVGTYEKDNRTYSIMVPEKANVEITYTIGERSFSFGRKSYHTIMNFKIADGNSTTDYSIKLFKAGEGGLNGVGNRYLTLIGVSGFEVDSTIMNKEISSSDICAQSAITIERIAGFASISYDVQ